MQELFRMLRGITDRLPELNYVWGLLVISIVGALITLIVGETKAAIIIIGLTIIGIVISLLVGLAFQNQGIAKIPAQLLVWTITVFFVCFLGFTVTAYAFSWPCNWAYFLGIPNIQCNSKNPTIPIPLKGWIWFGAIFNPSGNANPGEEIHSLGGNQPITIAPAVVPEIGSTVIITNNVNVRKCPPLPPHYQLCEQLGHFSPGTKIIVNNINAFVDKNTDPTYTRVWGEVENKIN